MYQNETKTLNPMIEVTVEERRQGPRLDPSQTRLLLARLGNGSEVELINVSQKGLLVETKERLLPNSRVKVRLVTDKGVILITAKVLRAKVVDRDDETEAFQSALVFDEELPPHLEQFLERALENMLGG